MRTSARIFFPRSLYHVYNKAVNSFIIFYSTEDCLVFLTMCFTLARKYGIVICSIAIMPNHFHLAIIGESKECLIGFMTELESKFATQYNKRHRRSGQLFKKSFGSAPKRTSKLSKACILYIADNAVAGKIVSKALGFRWNLLAYCESNSPFSERIVKRESSTALRKSCKAVDFWHARNTPLSYELLEIIFKGMTPKEKQSLTDYIISKYNTFDYCFIKRLFGEWTNFLLTLQASGGSEHDIEDDWDDYSAYGKMSSILIRQGEDLKTINFEAMDKAILQKYFLLLSRVGLFSTKQICKYLHIGMRDS